MPARRPRVSLRLQLIAVFGILLASATAMLVVEEISQYQASRALDSLKSRSLEGQRRLMAVFDAYGHEIVDSVWKVTHGRMGWAQAAGAVDNAATRITLHWQALELLPRSPEQQLLFEQAASARADADRLVERIRELIEVQDADGLRLLAEAELYAAIDPVTTRLRYLTDLELIGAERLVKEEDRRAWMVRWLRITLLLLMLGVSALIGRQILRNTYRGVESLVRLASTLQEGKFEKSPGYRPRGEMGEVMDAFLDMRGALRANEAELRASLEANEAVRQRLQERELFQRSLLQAAQIAIMSVDSSGRFTHLNPFAEKLIGSPAADLVGKATPDRLLVPSQTAQLAAELSQSLGHPVRDDWRLFLTLAAQQYPPVECLLQRADGSRVPVLQAVSAMHDDDGQLTGLLFVATDLTELKKLEDELRRSESRAQEANRAKSAFLAAMSHEIRTPMIGVTGMIEILNHTRLDEEQRRALNIIQHSADSLLQIIGDILDFSKIEAGRMELAPTTVSLRKLVASVGYNFLGSASSKGLELGFEVEPPVARAHVADPLRLRQILGNFLSNAVKFTEQGSIQVRVRVIEQDDDAQRLEFSVADTGIGISEEAQKRLFSAFSQADAHITRRFGGTGLGLAICQKLAQLMGGEVLLESREGVGTTLRLRVRLPLGNAEALPDEETAAASGEALFQPRPLPDLERAERERSLVLLVDDHPTNRTVIQRQLALGGFRCETAEDGQQGLEKWRSGRYALVLSDLHMPRLDGYELIAAIREEERARGLPRTPVVALTAAAMRGEAEKCLGAGMDDYLTKPVSLGTLSRCLHRWLPHLVPEPTPAVDPPARLALPQVDHPPPIDQAVLDEISGGDADTAYGILVDFLDTSVNDLRALRQSLDAGEPQLAAREAHRLRGAASLVGARGVVAAAALVEEAGRSGDHGALQRLLPDLDSALAQLRLYVESRLRE
ncbi:ATP-binding protein [Pseudomarimonas salicorniae]|uniref:histidine kinase n=1 Tax=Pseudomarimonas salicorniae TaxID=2933270 RepID=A0ABT0GG39_9GAMM|nr:ATP-binding protein [Lysobacter sp. CAU 1642]MCK7593413.1 ATP-binding protein [Lysobacter sp. CAU 1642]